ncbi:replication initiation protein [Arsenophonus nasoniae]|uniref:Replication initiation protein n=1 Tax=Arsenophonus nasoniae TaxID=638 RepID=A0AA95KBQ2_9GAMM|nr:replication initiation protein [Arsenophonus nasoniae]WGM03486.1 replication initiation protein [Arsenophonus nasoniae]
MLIKKSHQLVMARMNLSAREQDVLTLLVKALKKSFDDEKFGDGNVQYEFTFYVDELIEHFSLSRQGLYHALDEGTKVMGRIIEMKDPVKKTFEKVVIISKANFAEGVLFVRMDKDAAKYLLEYSMGFAEIDLNLLLSLKGGYEKRILEMISRFKSQKEFSISLGEFCRCVGSHYSEYSKFSNFKQTVLIKPIRRIVSSSGSTWKIKKDFKDGFIIEKKGRKYRDSDKIIFKIQYNNVEQKTNKTAIEVDTKKHEVLDYLLSKIMDKTANQSEAIAFISMSNELNVKYVREIEEQAKKIAKI